MLPKNYFDGIDRVDALFRGCGSFGTVDGTLTREGDTLVVNGNGYRLTSRIARDENGVVTREDVLENVGEESLSLSAVFSRFVFDGGEYEVYTQFNIWQNESMGAWQPLVTAVEVSNSGNRTAQNAAPFLALWSEQEKRGVAFHLFPNAAWKMSVRREHVAAKYTRVTVELGISDFDFNVTLEKGERTMLPKILCYEFKNRVDMDAYKLHAYMHTHHPRREMPFIYNTWMYHFDNFTADEVLSQIPLAADLGAEYFVIDAGWFGKGKNWTVSVGDWSENMVTGFAGRMCEVADAVRAHGMKFGIWLEPERAHAKSDAVRDHGDYYTVAHEYNDVRFLDFANPDARAWMLDVVSGLIEKYGVEYIKNDNNVDMQWDPRHASYYEYHRGRNAFVEALRAKYPNLYLTSCASGGEQMELATYTRFDSSWPSDNESPYTEMRIYKETLLRFPPQGFERWVAVHSLQGTESFYKSFSAEGGNAAERLVACGDAVWKRAEGITHSYLNGYMTGGPVGISTDLSLLSDHAFAEIKAHIARVKKERDFWKTAVARILCDTPSVTAYQYSDVNCSRAVLQLFTGKTQQTRFRLYPVLVPECLYADGNGKRMLGREWMEEGVVLESTPVWRDNWHEMLEVVLQIQS